MGIDLRTVFVVYGFGSLASLIAFSWVWFKSRTRFKGMGYLLVDFAFQVILLTFIALRGQIPDFLSYFVSNFLSIAGAIFLIVGLDKFSERKSNYTGNAILMIAFTSIYAWFLYVDPSLYFRSLFISITYGILFIQLIYRLIFENSVGIHRAKNELLFVFGALLLVNLIRVIRYLSNYDPNNDYLHSDWFESAFIMSYMFLYLFLVFAVIAMISKRLQAELEEEEAKYHAAFSNSSNGIMLIRGRDNMILEVNEGFERITGYSASEAKGVPSDQFHFWVDPKDREAYLSKLFKEGKSQISGVSMYRKDGQNFIANLSGQLVQINGETQAVSTLEDITDLHISVEQLKLKGEELRQLNATKDKLFSIVAHDLKNPMNNINALAAMIHESLLAGKFEEAKEFCIMLEKSGARATGLLTNLLDWARSQSGRIAFQPVQVSLREIVFQAVELQRENARLKEINLDSDPMPTDLLLNADQAMLHTILRNLISNAIKYSSPGGCINVGFLKEDAEAHVYVKDNGVGMDNGHLNALFNIEMSVTTPGTRQETGTGLGLVLCREFVERHGGRIWAESEQGKGSCFWFSLPLNS